MSRRFIALILAASTAIAASASGARADQTQDIAKIVGGIALLYIVGEALSAEADREKDKKKEKAKAKAKASQAKHGHASPYYTHRHEGYGAHQHRRDHSHRHDRWAENHWAATLPAECRVRLDGERHTSGKPRARVVYPQRCLARNFAAHESLPRQCAFRVETTRGKRLVYGERCLDRKGYNTPSRR
ncbi:hypothetical protein LR948_03645 [Roseivivax sp. GX 12232]|uniref:hypothetical protein n=1 Tax=Roseivivax sp. GX 12232 TaxID=2900547 RepID=UPI001E5603B8|nr:hypothetical protein [Roseivivax sp. GX 12232]MCE0504436.1 hypothetical protein [Roseivivax sp. GX 12232]